MTSKRKKLNGRGITSQRTLEECVAMQMFIVDHIDEHVPMEGVPEQYMYAHYINRLCGVIDVFKQDDDTLSGRTGLLSKSEIEYERRFIQFGCRNELIPDDQREYATEFFNVLHKVRLVLQKLTDGKTEIIGINKSNLEVLRVLFHEAEKHGIDASRVLPAAEVERGTDILSEFIMSHKTLVPEEDQLTDSDAFYVKEILKRLFFAWEK